MTEEEFDKMQLPLINSEEDLEQISKDKLRPIFSVNKFQIREEVYRDKGIDLSLELKRNLKFTNFRFLIQLKATASLKKNNDSSFSVQIKTSNIEYLLNAGIPAYYVLYDFREDKFYYKNVKDFLIELTQKEKNWSSQGKHSLRLKKVLNTQSSEDLYKDVFSTCLASRNLHEKLVLRNVSFQSPHNIIIDINNDIYSDVEIVDIIKTYGLQLINELKFNEIIELSNKIVGNVPLSSLHYLVIGLVYFYKGEIFKAIANFKDSKRKLADLTPELQNHLKYIDLFAKHQVGLISSDIFKKQASKLEENSNIKYYLDVENAKQHYIANFISGDNSNFDEYLAKLDKIIHSGDSTENHKSIASLEKFQAWGDRIVSDYYREVLRFKQAQASFPLGEDVKASVSESIEETFNQWYKEFSKFINYLLDKNFTFNYHLARIAESKIWYKYTVYWSFNRYNYDQEIDTFDNTHDLNEDFLEYSLQNIRSAKEYFTKIQHFNNKCAALAIEYEILDFFKKEEEALKTINELELEMDLTDSEPDKAKFSFLKEEGTFHQRLRKLIKELPEKAQSFIKEWEEKVKLMQEWDQEDKNKTIDSPNGSYSIDLFPIGMFLFPKESLGIVHDILKINDDELREQLSAMHEIVTPIINILYENITQEGPREGNLAHKWGVSDKNIYRIRKAFYENKFLRIK